MNKIFTYSLSIKSKCLQSQHLKSRRKKSQRRKRRSESGGRRRRRRRKKRKRREKRLSHLLHDKIPKAYPFLKVKMSSPLLPMVQASGKFRPPLSRKSVAASEVEDLCSLRISLKSSHRIKGT